MDEAAVPPPVADAAIDVNRDARVAGLQSALTVLALFAAVGLLTARRIPARPQRSAPTIEPPTIEPPTIEPALHEPDS